MHYKIPIQIIEMEMDNFHLLVEAVFNDGETVFWTIDTGASKTVFDINLKEHIQCEEETGEELHAAAMSSKPLQTSSGIVKPFKFGKLKVEQLSTALFDLNHINELYANVTDFRICGLLGSDFLLKYKAVIDYKRKRLVLSC